MSLSFIVTLFVLIIVLGVVFWGARTLLAAFAVPEPVKAVVLVLLVLIALLVVLQTFGLWPGGGETLRIQTR